MEYGDLCGENKSRYGKQLLIDALADTARAPGPGRLRIFSQVGASVGAAYERYGRNAGSSAVWGACHAKLMYAYPYLMVGSTNWSVSSEANQELSLILEIEDEETRNYVEAKLHEMKAGAILQSGSSIAASQRPDPSRDSRPRGRAAG